MVTRQLKDLYTSIVDLRIHQDSGNDDQAVCLTSFSNLVLFKLSDYSSASTSLSFPVGKDASCLGNLPNVLLVADYNGRLSGYSWSSLRESYMNRRLALSCDFCEKISELEIDSLLEIDESKIIIGCSDGTLQIHDTESSIKKPISKLSCHSAGVINGLAKRSVFEFVSCTSDSLVHLWDLRCNNKPARTLNVGSETRVARNNFSKEIYCLDISGDFVVCGGGVELGLWHLSSSSLATVLSTSTSNEASNDLYYAVEFIEGGRVLAGGSSSCLKLYNYSGDLIQSINSFKNLYTVNVLKTIDTGIPSKMTLVAGESTDVHILSNYGYISASINIIGS